MVSLPSPFDAAAPKQPSLRHLLNVDDATSIQLECDNAKCPAISSTSLTTAATASTSSPFSLSTMGDSNSSLAATSSRRRRRFQMCSRQHPDNQTMVQMPPSAFLHPAAQVNNKSPPPSRPCRWESETVPSSSSSSSISLLSPAASPPTAPGPKRSSNHQSPPMKPGRTESPRQNPSPPGDRIAGKTKTTSNASLVDQLLLLELDLSSDDDHSNHSSGSSSSRSSCRDAAIRLSSSNSPKRSI